MLKRNNLTIKQQYFDSLRSIGQYTGSFADQIALLYVYLPIVRQEVYQYVNLWNSHTIRFQKGRLELPTGKPVVLYFTPPHGIPDYGIVPPSDLLEQMKADVKDYGQSQMVALCVKFCTEWTQN